MSSRRLGLRSVVFFVWRDTTHPEGGGSELFVERVAAHLVTLGWAVTICCADYPGAVRDEVRDGIRFRRRGGRLTVYLHALGYLLSRQGRRADVVVDVQNGVPFFSPLVRRHAIVNLVHHVHKQQWRIIYPGLTGRLGWLLESKVAPWLYRHHPYVTVSEATRGDLIALGVDAARISIVQNGVDLSGAGPLRPRAAAPTVCVLGRLVPHKQVEHALDVVASLRPTMPNIHLDVVGEGWWHDRLIAHATELGVIDAVTFHGWVADQERDAILDSSWLLLVPSVKEGWGIGIMEAAAHGVPALAYSTAGGVTESVVDGETGWLVDHLAGLEKRTEELLTDAELRTRLGENAHARAATFSWSRTGRKFADVVEQLGA
jgi:glycosyltransferase involved in cell wall biosynthesis